jgi:hypothetical protein
LSSSEGGGNSSFTFIVISKSVILINDRYIKR